MTDRCYKLSWCGFANSFWRTSFGTT